MTDDNDRDWQNGFERYKDPPPALATWKDGYGGSHLLDYRDMGEVIEDD